MQHCFCSLYSTYVFSWTGLKVKDLTTNMGGFFVLLKTIPESRFPEDLIRGQKYKIATFEPGYHPFTAEPINDVPADASSEQKAGFQTGDLNDLRIIEQ